MSRKKLPKNAANLDVLLGVPSFNDPNELMIWCPKCATWHLHGIGEGIQSSQCPIQNTNRYTDNFYVKRISLQAAKELHEALRQYLNYRKMHKRIDGNKLPQQNLLKNPYNLDVLIGLPRFDDPRMPMVWCPKCAKFHLHGFGDGLRAPHCQFQNENKYENSYYLKQISDVEAEALFVTLDKFLDYKRAERKQKTSQNKLQKPRPRNLIQQSRRVY